MDVDSEEQSSERAELHFLAALVDELMKALLLRGVMDRIQLQAIEVAVSERVGTEPRTWRSADPPPYARPGDDEGNRRVRRFSLNTCS
jgi:hypothetical protein